MLRYKTKTRPGLVALYDIRPGNGADSYNPRARMGRDLRKSDEKHAGINWGGVSRLLAGSGFHCTVL